MEKHLRKKQKEDSEDKLTDTALLGAKIADDSDMLEATNRKIAFGDLGTPSTNYDIVNEETKIVKDEVGNTAQFLKFLNESLKHNTEKIKSIKQSYEDNSSPTKSTHSSIMNEPTVKLAKDELQLLEAQRQEMEKKISGLLSEIDSIKNDIAKTDNKIIDKRTQIEFLITREENKLQSKNDMVWDELVSDLKKIKTEESKDEIEKLVNSVMEKYKISK